MSQAFSKCDANVGQCSTIGTSTEVRLGLPDNDRGLSFDRKRWWRPGPDDEQFYSPCPVPYVATVVLLAGFFGRAAPPKGLGVPYGKEQ